ncbi:MAG TPA: NF038122 family metalloprotease, partial [Blastocatellia bacterium]|nr:NF038122 family metalloprotease [Blastocatellia bacterium]
TPQLDSFPAARDAFVAAAERWEAFIQDNITVIIDVDFGPTRFGEMYPPGVLGSTGTQNLFNLSGYSGLRQALVNSASSPAETALYNTLPATNIPTDLGATTGMGLPSANLRALGLINAMADPDNEPGFGAPPSIGFNSAFDFDFDPSDGIDADKIDFDAVAVHEIGHALGFVSQTGLLEINPLFPLVASAWDLFRFRPGTTTGTFPTAQRILTSGGSQTFFEGNGDLALSTGRPNGTGGDGRQSSHWKDDALTGQFIGIMDPTIGPGVRETISSNDRLVLDRIGYELAGCTYTIAPASQSFAANGGSGSINITAADGCAWNAVSNDAWITIDSGSSGSGNGMVSYSVAANPGAANRSGTITAAGQAFTVLQGINFSDVALSHPFYTEIGKLSARGATLGCNTGMYCPDDVVTRQQMAAFIIRALGNFNPPTPAMQRFLDVPPTNPFYAFIEQMALLQITLGCGGGNYCPGDPVLRDQMAAFIIRALHEPGYTPPTPAMQRFADVPPTNPFYAHIEEMAVRQITLGCGGGNYCPTLAVSRGQMAAFLVRAFNL